MSLVTKERYGFLMQKVLQLLSDYPDGLQAKTVIEQLAKTIDLTEHEKGFYSEGSRRFDKILRFATIAAVKAGWLIKNKGIWLITEPGKQALKKFKSHEDLIKEALHLYKQWKSDQDVNGEEASIGSDIEALGVGVLEEAEERAWQEVQAYIHKMPEFSFQNLVSVLLTAMGYYVYWEAPPGKDDGVDIIAFRDSLGVQTPRVKVQVKHRENTKVSLDELKAFLANLGHQDTGIYVSTGGFTKDADVKSRSHEKHATLIDLERFVELWIEHYDKIDETARNILPLKPVYYLSLGS